MAPTLNNVSEYRRIRPNAPHRRNQKWLKVIYSNVRSILNKIDELKAVAASYHPNIIALSETWLYDLVPDSLISIDGYNMFRCDRSGRRGGVL